MAVMADFVTGARLAVRGARHALGPGRALGACWPVVITGLVLTIALQAGGIALALAATDLHPASRVAQAVVALATVVAVVAAAALGALLGIVLTALLLPLWGERILMHGLRAIDPARAEALARLPGLPLATQVTNAIRRFVPFALLMALGFAVSFIPVVGVIGPIIEAATAARFLAWELLEPWMTRTGRGHAEQAALLRRHRALLMGFALPWVPALAIPLAGPLAFALAQSATAVLLDAERSHISDQRG